MEELRIVITASFNDTEEEFRYLFATYNIIDANIEIFLPRTGAMEGDMVAGYRYALSGSPKAIMVAPDIPYLSVAMVDDLFAALDAHDLVFHPNIDGTALPHGMKKAVDIFSGMNTRSSNWLSEWLSRIKTANLSYKMFYPVFDIDRFEDLIVFYQWQLFLEDSKESSLFCPQTMKFLKPLFGR